MKPDGLLRKAAYWGINALGFPTVCRKLLKKNRSLSIMLHGVFPEVALAPLKKFHFGVSASAFRQILYWINKEGLEVINSEQLIEGKPGVHLTFDDGYANNYTAAFPILEEFGYPFTVFVATCHLRDASNFQARPLSYFDSLRKANPEIWNICTDVFLEQNWNGLRINQLQALSASPLVEIGAHSHEHLRLHHLTFDAQEKDIATNKSILEQYIQKPVRYFAYPYGCYNADTIHILKSLGYSAAFAVKPSGLGKNVLFELPRVGLYQSNKNYLSSKLSFWRRTLDLKKIIPTKA